MVPSKEPQLHDVVYFYFLLMYVFKVFPNISISFEIHMTLCIWII